VSCLLAACLDGSADPIVRVSDDVRSTQTDAGVVGDAGVDAAAGSGQTPTFALYYDNLEPSADAPAINFSVKVHNLTGAEVALRRLSVRYFFHNELAQPWETTIFYTGTCCRNTRSPFNDQVEATVHTQRDVAGADTYLELTFAADAGTLLAGDAVQVEVSFHAPGYERRVAQANDYSFSASAAGTQAEWDLCPGVCTKFGAAKLTLYDEGALVLGTPP
jgi:hypothetical protein